jgi:hypothetical protein
MPKTKQSSQPEFEILTDKDDMLDLYGELGEVDLSDFGEYATTVSGTVYNTLSKPNTYTITAYGPNGEVWGITTGQMFADRTANEWWVLRAKLKAPRGLGSQLIRVRDQFLLEEGIRVVRTTADTENGRKLIESYGGALVAGSKDEYVYFLSQPDMAQAAK